MTAAKPLQRKEVDKVMASLRSALAQEWPSYDDQLLDFPPALAEPTTKRAKVLLEAYKRAWAASVRFSRREQKGLASKRGLGAAFFDDRQTDLAIASLERARALVRNAREALQHDMTRISKERARRGLVGDDFGNHPVHVLAIERLEKAIGVRASKIQTFEDIPQARTRGEWDAFLSETAKNLLGAGFGTREVAGLLTGEKPEVVDRATLERFRQRVSRLENSRG
jgi:hypothetical protein